MIEVAKEGRVPVVDFGLLAQRLSADGVPGDALFLDHVHPNVEMHRALALATLAVMNTEGWVEPGLAWNEAAIERVSRRVRGRIDRNAQGKALRNLAIVLGYTGKFAESGRVALQAVKLVPRDGQAHYLAGVAMARSSNLQAAARHLRRAVDLRVEVPEFRSAYGWVLLRQGETSAAIREFRRVLALVPRHAPAHTQLGLARIEQGALALAEARFERALALQPGLVEASQGLSRVRAMQGVAPPGHLANQ